LISGRRQAVKLHGVVHAYRLKQHMQFNDMVALIHQLSTTSVLKRVLLYHTCYAMRLRGRQVGVHVHDGQEAASEWHPGCLKWFKKHSAQQQHRNTRSKRTFSCSSSPARSLRCISGTLASGSS
jgi:hypothetical protein